MPLFSPAVRLFLAPTLIAISSAAYAEPKSLTIDDPRPVAKAVEELEAIYGRPITYEDPPYVHESAMVDVTAQVRPDGRTAGAPVSARLLIPRGGAFSFHFDEALPATALKEMLLSHSTALSAGAETFRVIESDGLLHVAPVEFTNASGHREKIKPLLDLTVSLPLKQRTGADLIEELCHSLSLAVGQTVVTGTAPLSLLATRTTAVTASNEPARSVLDRLFKEIDVPLSWQLFYDPGLRWYVLNIHMVRAAK